MKNDQHRGVSSPRFSAVREVVRVYRECVSQTVLSWPLQTSKRLLLDSGLDSAWSKNRFAEVFADCLQDLDAHLGPAYHHLFTQALTSLKTERMTPPVSFDEIKKILDQSAPDWSHDFILERAPLHTTPLYQIHTAIDEEGQRWLFKVIKPSARVKLESSVNALREIELALKPLRALAKVSALAIRIEDLRRSYQREADLKYERRTLQRMKNKAETDEKSALKFPRVHERLGTENLLVFERMEGFPLSFQMHNWKSLEAKNKNLNWSLQPIQASVLKAFEMGLVRNVDDTEKLIMMRDGTVGVRFGWAAMPADSSDRRQAANLLRALYIQDVSGLNNARAVSGDFDRRMTELSRGGQSVTFVELAEVTFACSKSLGIELPNGFVDIAKSLQSLEGIGRPLVVKRTSTSVASFGYPVRSVAQEIALNSPIVRARRLYGR